MVMFIPFGLAVPKLPKQEHVISLKYVDEVWITATMLESPQIQGLFLLLVSMLLLS